MRIVKRYWPFIVLGTIIFALTIFGLYRLELLAGCTGSPCNELRKLQWESISGTAIAAVIAVVIFISQRTNEINDRKSAAKKIALARIKLATRRIAFALSEFTPPDDPILIDLSDPSYRLNITPQQIYDWTNSMIFGCSIAVPIFIDALRELDNIPIDPDVDTDLADQIFWARESLFEIYLKYEKASALGDQPNYDFFGTWQSPQYQETALKIADNLATAVTKANELDLQLFKIFDHNNVP